MMQKTTKNMMFDVFFHYEIFTFSDYNNIFYLIFIKLNVS